MPTSTRTATGLDHLRGDEAGAADGGDEDVSLARDGGEIDGLAVADGDGGGGVEKQHRHGLANDVRATEDDGVFAGDGEVAAMHHFHHARGGAGLKAGLARDEAADVDGVEAVDVFGGGDGFEEALGIDVFGERELDEDAVDLVAAVEGVDHGEEFVGGDGLGGGDHLRVDSELAAGLDFAADVDLAGSDVADEDDGEARTKLMEGEGLDFRGDFGLDLGGDGDSVKDDWSRSGWVLHRAILDSSCRGLLAARLDRWGLRRRSWSGWFVRFVMGGLRWWEMRLIVRLAGGGIRLWMACRCCWRGGLRSGK